MSESVDGHSRLVHACVPTAGDENAPFLHYSSSMTLVMGN